MLRQVLRECSKNKTEYKLELCEAIIYILTLNEIIPFNVMSFLVLLFPLRVNNPSSLKHLTAHTVESKKTLKSIH